jgi:hypothetical protein
LSTSDLKAHRSHGLLVLSGAKAAIALRSMVHWSGFSSGKAQTKEALAKLRAL